MTLERIGRSIKNLDIGNSYFAKGNLKTKSISVASPCPTSPACSCDTSPIRKCSALPDFSDPLSLTGDCRKTANRWLKEREATLSVPSPLFLWESGERG